MEAQIFVFATLRRLSPVKGNEITGKYSAPSLFPFLPATMSCLPWALKAEGELEHRHKHLEKFRKLLSLFPPSLHTATPWCTWMSWKMLSRRPAMLRREVNARSSSGHCQSHHSVPNCGDEAQFHGWVWNHAWSWSWENCTPHRKAEQMGSHQPYSWCAAQRSKKIAGQLAATLPAWFIALATSVLRSQLHGIMNHEEARQKHTGGKILGSFSRDVRHIHRKRQWTMQKLGWGELATLGILLRWIKVG